jgi:hypothetical protein
VSDERAPESLIPESWTAKEVIADLKRDIVHRFDQQDDVLDDISKKVDGKADKADVVSLGLEMKSLGDRVGKLEEHHVEETAAAQFRHRVWAAIGSVAGIIAIIVGSIIAGH